jgi:hypothetical protein
MPTLPMGNESSILATSRPSGMIPAAPAAPSPIIAVIAACSLGPATGSARTSPIVEFADSGTTTSSPSISTAADARMSRLDAATSTR